MLVQWLSHTLHTSIERMIDILHIIVQLPLPFDILHIMFQEHESAQHSTLVVDDTLYLPSQSLWALCTAQRREKGEHTAFYLAKVPAIGSLARVPAIGSLARVPAIGSLVFCINDCSFLSTPASWLGATSLSMLLSSQCTDQLHKLWSASLSPGCTDSAIQAWRSPLRLFVQTGRAGFGIPFLPG